MSIWRITSHVAALLLIGAASAYGQEPGMICGTTTDSAGAVLAGVTVTLARGAETPARTTTDSAGKYLFANVSVGTYTLSFTLDGFKRTLRSNVVIVPRLEYRVDQKLERGLPLPLDPPTSRPVVSTKKETVTNTVQPPHPCTAPR